MMYNSFWFVMTGILYGMSWFGWTPGDSNGNDSGWCTMPSGVYTPCPDAGGLPES